MNKRKMETIKLYFTMFLTTLLILTGIIGLFSLVGGFGYEETGAKKYATDEMKYVIRLLFPFAVSVSMLMIGYFFGKDKGRLEVLEKKEEVNNGLEYDGN